MNELWTTPRVEDISDDDGNSHSDNSEPMDLDNDVNLFSDDAGDDDEDKRARHTTPVTLDLDSSSEMHTQVRHISGPG